MFKILFNTAEKCVRCADLETALTLAIASIEYGVADQCSVKFQDQSFRVDSENTYEFKLKLNALLHGRKHKLGGNS